MGAGGTRPGGGCEKSFKEVGPWGTVSSRGSMEQGYEGVKLGEGCGVVSGPCSNWNHLWKAGGGHGGAQLALLPARGWLAKWGKMAASLWGAGWSPASGQPPMAPPPGETRTELLAGAFLIHPVLASGVGASPTGDSGGAFTVADQVGGPLPKWNVNEVEWGASRSGGRGLVRRNKGKLGYQLL